MAVLTGKFNPKAMPTRRGPIAAPRGPRRGLGR